MTKLRSNSVGSGLSAKQGAMLEWIENDDEDEKTKRLRTAGERLALMKVVELPEKSPVKAREMAMFHRVMTENRRMDLKQDKIRMQEERIRLDQTRMGYLKAGSKG